MKTYKYIIFIVFGILGLVSCRKELMIPITGDNTAIVESYLKAGDTSALVYISKIIPFSDDTNDSKVMIPGLNVFINGRKLTEIDTGVYQLPMTDERITAGTTYKLEFQYAGKDVTSETTVPSAPEGFKESAAVVYTTRITSTSSGFPAQMDPVELSWINPDTSYYYVLIKYMETTPDYINSRFTNTDFQFIQSSTPTQENTYRLDQRMIRCFGTYRIILYKVNNEFNDVFTKNGTNSNNLVNPTTNITNGYGVFTGMNSDTLYLEVIPN